MSSKSQQRREPDAPGRLLFWRALVLLFESSTDSRTENRGAVSLAGWNRLSNRDRPPTCSVRDSGSSSRASNPASDPSLSLRSSATDAAAAAIAPAEEPPMERNR